MPQVRVVAVDATGVTVVGAGEPLVDVHLEGRRIWSFRPAPAAAERLVAWPQPLERFLTGPAAVRVDVDGVAGFEDEVALGPGETGSRSSTTRAAPWSWTTRDGSR